jgi:uncharacterized protein (TIGR00255 family)
MDMTSSMTAFARHDGQTQNGTFAWEIRSVNSRYLEPHFRLPDQLREVESLCRETLRQRIARGKVECALKFIPAVAEQNLNVNEDLVRRISMAADQVHNIIGPGTALSALEILQWPGVLSAQQFDASALLQDAHQAFAQAVSKLLTVRKTEGAALEEVVRGRIEGIAAQVDKVRENLPVILAQQKQNLLDKFAALQVDVNPERIEQEMVLLVQRADVEEELDRLGVHIAEVRRILVAREPSGRRLDFMMQELNREANTLGSKSLSTITTQCSVELKVLIEQMREQVQNIE